MFGYPNITKKALLKVVREQTRNNGAGVKEDKLMNFFHPFPSQRHEHRLTAVLLTCIRKGLVEYILSSKGESRTVKAVK